MPSDVIQVPKACIPKKPVYVLALDEPHDVLSTMVEDTHGSTLHIKCRC